MNTKKDYERAARLISRYYENAPQVGRDNDGEPIFNAMLALAVEGAFVQFFGTDNPKFNEKKFRLACKGNKQ